MPINPKKLAKGAGKVAKGAGKVVKKAGQELGVVKNKGGRPRTKPRPQSNLTPTQQRQVEFLKGEMGSGRHSRATITEMRRELNKIRGTVMGRPKGRLDEEPRKTRSRMRAGRDEETGLFNPRTRPKRQKPQSTFGGRAANEMSMRERMRAEGYRDVRETSRLEPSSRYGDAPRRRNKPGQGRKRIPD